MAGYTKEDFDSLYSIRVRLWDESIQGFRRSPIRLNYHRYVMQDISRTPWDKLVPELGITSSDIVVVVGSGFGWGVERLIELTNCTAIGVDTSDHVHSTKDTTEESEIDAAIIASGYDPLVGHGLEVKTAVLTEPRSKSTVLNENMYSVKSRNNVKKAIGNKLPTWIITEDMLSDFTDAEIIEWKTQIDKLGVAVCHFVRENKLPNAKTAEEWNALTGHTIVTVGAFRRVG